MRSSESKPTTVQQTSKLWKIGMAIGIVLMIVGVGRLILQTPYGMPLTTTGLVTFVICRLGAFVFHG